MARFCNTFPLLFVFVFGGLGCSRKSEPSRFSIQLPQSYSKAIDFSSFNDDDLSDPWLGSINSADEINCYIVFAGAPEKEMSRHYCLDQSTNLTLVKFGVYAGGIPSGSKVVIDVPAGKKRSIVLLGTHAMDGACTEFLGRGPPKNKMTHPRILVSQTMDLESGTTKSVEMKIPRDLSVQGEVGDCFIDKPWGDDNGTEPFPEIQLVITDVTGNKDSMDISGGSSPGTANIFRVTNNGSLESSSLDSAVGVTNSTYFNISGNTCSGVLAPGQSCLITIEPTASMDTSYSSVLSLSVDNIPSITLTGTATGFGGPIATISSGQPMAIDNSSTLSILVGGAGVTHYKYKVGLDASTDCTTIAGYSSEVAVGTAITDSLTDGDLEICIIGKDANMNWQSETMATSFAWTKDTVSPSVLVSSPVDPGPASASPILVNIVFSEDVSGFSLGGLTVSNATASNFTQLSQSQYSVDLIPNSPNTTVSMNINSLVATDSAGNTNGSSTPWSLYYQPDVTADSITWADFYNMSSMEFISGLDVAVSFEFSVTSVTGAPVIKYRLNNGVWVAFTSLAPSSELVMNGDSIEFQVSGAIGDVAGIDIKNLTDGGALVDSLIGTVEDPCNLGPSIGAICFGGSLYAGAIISTEYMVTPAGCTDSSTPTCTGSDTTQKKWHGSGGSTNDVTALVDVTDSTMPDPTDGDTNTANLVADASIDSDSAADYCNDMNFGGYTDWYLPSKTELAYLYCKSNAVSHDPSYPNEDSDCVSFGGKSSELQGFATGAFYWSSSEGSSLTGWRMGFDNGVQNLATKANPYYVRCIRKK